MNHISRNIPVALLCGYLLCISIGCSCAPTQHPVNVSISPEFKETPTITVMITALDPNEAVFLAGYPMSKFFQAGDNERGGLNKVEMKFGPNQPTTQSFSPASKEQWEQHWKQWQGRGATNLFVLAAIPGKFEDKKGNLDARRQMVPLGSCRWDKADQPINFQITPGKIESLTPPKQGR